MDSSAQVFDILAGGYRNATGQFSLMNRVGYWYAVNTDSSCTQNQTHYLAPNNQTIMDPLNGKGQIGSKFGLRVLEGKEQFHFGLDLTALTGTPIYAIADGWVMSVNSFYNGNHCNAGDDKCGNGFGNYIKINHLNGLIVTYAHLIDSIVSEKNTISNPYYGKDCYTPKKIQSKYRVKKGELIGFVGNSGFSRGSHLHIEIKAEAKSKWEAMSYENSLPIPNIDTTFKLKKFIDPLKILSINSNLNRGFKINFWFYSKQHSIFSHDQCRGSEGFSVRCIKLK